MIHSNFPRCFYPTACCKILHYVIFRGRRHDVNKDSPLEVAGLPGSAAANEIMRNVWVCFTNAPRQDPCCNVVLFDCPLSRQGHQSSTGKLRAWLTGCRVGKPEEDGSCSGDEMKKPVNGHKETKTCLCRAEKWVQSLGRECKSAWDAAWCHLTANPHSKGSRDKGRWAKRVWELQESCEKRVQRENRSHCGWDTGTWKRHRMP